jgi:hypothetical protein
MSTLRTLQSAAMILALAACFHTSSHFDTDAFVPDEGALTPRDNVDLAKLTPDQMAAMVTRQATDSAALIATGFPQRRATVRGGYFISPAKLAEMSPRTISDIFRQVPVLVESPLPIGQLLGGGQGCFITYVNGLKRSRVPSDLDAYIPAHDVVAAEVYPPGQMAPAPFLRASSQANCTTVALWTRSKAD